MESKPEEEPKTQEEEPKTEELHEEDKDETKEEEEDKEEVNKPTGMDESQKKMVMDLVEQLQASAGDPKNPKNQAAMKEIKKYKTLYDKHDFWDTQPVPKVTSALEEGEIEKGKLADVQQEPYALPEGYEW